MNRKYPTSPGSMSNTAIGLLLIVSLVAILTYFYRLEVAPPSITYLMLAVDPSGTIKQHNRCLDIERLGRKFLADNQGEMHLTLFQLGSRTTGGLPIRLGTITRQRSLKLLESTGQEGDPNQDRAFLNKLGSFCQQVKPQKTSQVFGGLQGMINNLSGINCQLEHIHCSIWLRGDGLEEGGDLNLMRRLKQMSNPKSRGLLHTKLDKIKSRINNKNISVTICGTANRQLHRPWRNHPLSNSDLLEVYRPEFKAPELVSIQSECAPFIEIPTAASDATTTLEGERNGQE